MKKFMQRKKKGFTLVELLVVVAILGILMLLAVPKFLDSTKSAKVRTFESNYRTAVSQINLYIANNNGSATGVDADETTKEFLKSIEGKPKGATYVINDTTLTAALDGKELGGTTGDGDYKIIYNATTGKVEQNYGAADGLTTDLKTE